MKREVHKGGLRRIPLPFTSRNEWRYRWCVTKSWGRLHRVVAGEQQDGDDPANYFVGVSDGRSACGLTGDFHMPGIFSRMGCPRCLHCCREVGVPPGDGAPYNAHVPEPGCEGPA